MSPFSMARTVSTTAENSSEGRHRGAQQDVRRRIPAFVDVVADQFGPRGRVDDCRAHDMDPVRSQATQLRGQLGMGRKSGESIAAASWAATTTSERLPSATTTTSGAHRKFSPDRVMASVARAPVATGDVPPVGSMHR